MNWESLRHDEKVVAISEVKGQLFVATNKRVFQAMSLIDTEYPQLVELRFVSADEYDKEGSV